MIMQQLLSWANLEPPTWIFITDPNLLAAFTHMNLIDIPFLIHTFHTGQAVHITFTGKF